MIHRRGVVPALVLLSLVAIGVVLQIVRGPAPASPAPAPAQAPGAQSMPTAPTAEARAVLRSLVAVRRAYEAGNVRRLCRPGALVDPAVIRAQNAGRDGCESEIESLVAHAPRLRFTVRDVALRPDLATVVVSVSGGGDNPVDFVRQRGHWLLSFSAGNDPMPVLAGAP
jgi:hypothetical protein